MTSLEFPTSLSFWLACPLVLIISLLAASLFPRQPSSLPPSPPADPIIGHARIIPVDYQWKTFASWRKKYGLCTPEVSDKQIMLIMDTIRRHNLCYCARPPDGNPQQLHRCQRYFKPKYTLLSTSPYPPRIVSMLLASRCRYPDCSSMGWSQTLAFLPYGGRWQKQRRLTLKFFGNEALRSFRSGFQDELVIFHKGIWKSPDRLHKHITRYRIFKVLMINYSSS